MKNISDKDTFEKREEKKLFIETYGCQMNVADSEVVASIMQMAGYTLCDTIEDSDAIFVNTCSIRDNAEQKVLSRLSYFQSLRKHKKSLVIGVLGCMAERVREQLITENGVDLVVGPDSYLDLPNLVGAAERGEKAVNVELSTTETYREVIPSRIGHNRISGFISIMRGCNNFCSYCIVPYTRGRERSREPESILGELADLKIKGFKEVTLLGQNVNSYRYERRDSENYRCLPQCVPSHTPSGAVGEQSHFEVDEPEIYEGMVSRPYCRYSPYFTRLRHYDRHVQRISLRNRCRF